MPRMLAELGRLIYVKFFPFYRQNRPALFWILESQLILIPNLFFSFSFSFHFLLLWSREHSLSPRKFLSIIEENIDPNYCIDATILSDASVLDFKKQFVDPLEILCEDIN